jgi:hypothetical protein
MLNAGRTAIHVTSSETFQQADRLQRNTTPIQKRHTGCNIYKRGERALTMIDAAGRTEFRLFVTHICHPFRCTSLYMIHYCKIVKLSLCSQTAVMESFSSLAAAKSTRLRRQGEYSEIEGMACTSMVYPSISLAPLIVVVHDFGWSSFLYNHAHCVAQWELT